MRDIAQRDGIDVEDEVYEYLVSDVIHRDQSDPGNDKNSVPEKQLHRWTDDGGALPPPD